MELSIFIGICFLAGAVIGGTYQITKAISGLPGWKDPDIDEDDNANHIRIDPNENLSKYLPKGK